MDIRRLRNGRVQTREFDAVKALQPAALPGSTFVEAPRTDGGAKNLYALADALGNLSGAISGWNRRRQADQANMEAAQKQAHKDQAEGLPVDSMSKESLAGVIQSPEYGDPAKQKAAVALGKKVGSDFTTELEQKYAEYDPAQHGTVRQFLEAQSQEYLDKNMPWDDPGQSPFARQGAWSVVETFIADKEKAEADFLKNKYKADVEQGVGAAATHVLQEGTRRNLPNKVIASAFLSDWASLRKDTQGSRANPAFLGADVDKQFKTAVEGLAEQGQVDLVREILTQQVEGRPSALIKFAPEMKWAEETLTKAEKVATDKKLEGNWATLTSLEADASEGKAPDSRINEYLDKKIISESDAQRISLKNKLAEVSLIEKARTEREKLTFEAKHDEVKQAVVVDRLSALMQDGGGTARLWDRKVPAKDGTGEVDYTVDQQKKDIESFFWKALDAQSAQIADPAQREEFRLHKQVEFFAKNGDLNNSQWEGLFKSVGTGSSIEALANMKGEVPQHLRDAANIYTKLADKNWNLAASYVKDEKTRLILETYRIALTQAEAYPGGGTGTEQQAWNMAAQVARRIASDPSTLRGISWNDKLKKKVDSGVADTGNGWFSGAATVTPEARTQARNLADFYFKTGMMDEDAAIKEATKVVQKDYVQIGNGTLVNAQGIADKEEFSKFVDDTLASKLQLAHGGPFSRDTTADDFNVQKMNGDWVIHDSRGYPLMDRDGEWMKITTADYQAWQKRQAAILLDEKKRLGEEEQRKSLYVNVPNGGKRLNPELFKGENLSPERQDVINRLIEEEADNGRKAAVWEEQMLSREGNGSVSFFTKLEGLMANTAAQARKDRAERLGDTSAPINGWSALIDAQVWKESRGNPTAVSPSGNHIGLMQVGIDTAAVDAAKALGLDSYLTADRSERVRMLMDPAINKKLGEKYMQMMLKEYNTPELALIAYNWGQGNTNKWLKAGAKWEQLPAETQDYVKSIMARSNGEINPSGPDLGVLTGTQPGRQPLDMSGLKPEVLDKWKQVQTAFGMQVPIVSAFRDPERNSKAGGAKGSRHMHGDALDLDVSRLSKAQRLKLIEAASAAGFTGIGVYSNSIHLDTGRRRAWGPTHSSASIPGWAYSTVMRHIRAY